MFPHVSRAETLVKDFSAFQGDQVGCAYYHKRLHKPLKHGTRRPFHSRFLIMLCLVQESVIPSYAHG
jgi:hypothetical protein